MLKVENFFLFLTLWHQAEVKEIDGLIHHLTLPSSKPIIETKNEVAHYFHTTIARRRQFISTYNPEYVCWEVIHGARFLSLSLQTAEEAERGQSHQAARGSLWCAGEARWRVSHLVV